MKLKSEKILQFIGSPIAVHLYDSVDSTNDEAKRRADSGICLYATQHQTAGRGRRGHSFYSPKDTGLYLTLSLPLAGTPTGAPASVQKITCAAAVAVCEAVEALSGKQPQIKWVNDILLDGKKTAGILTELLTDNKNQPRAVIIGIGLNLNTNEFPAAFAKTAGNLGEIEPNALCGTIADRLIGMYRHLNDNSIIEKYKQRNVCIGKTVTYQKDDHTHTAQAVDIDADGGLVIEENGSRTTLHSGEISVVI